MHSTNSNGLTTPHSQPADIKTLNTNSIHPNGNDIIIEVAQKLSNIKIGCTALPNNSGEALPTHGDAIASDANTAITVTIFPNKLATAGSQKSLEWRDLLAIHAEPDVRKDKDSLPLIKYSVLPANSRAAGTVPENITAIVGDYDDEKVTIDDAAKLLAAAGICAFFYTTRRHHPKRPRWRVVASLAGPISCDALERHLDVLNGALGGILAPESWESTRCYFYGRVAGNQYQFLETQGIPLDRRIAETIDWEPITKKRGLQSQDPKANKEIKAIGEDRAFDRAFTIHQADDRTIHDLSIALETIKDRAEPRAEWNETFLALLSLKGTPYEHEARVLIEDWSQKHSEKWCAIDDDSTKWDRDSSGKITFASVFFWADQEDRKNGVYGTPLGWHAIAAGDRGRTGDIPDRSGNVVSYSDFTAALEPPFYVWHHVLQKGCLYALTAKWGHGKTAIMVTVALHIAMGVALGGHATKPTRVLYLCGENPEDVRLRARAAALKFGVEDVKLASQIYFTKRPLSLDDPAQLRRFVEDAATFGPFGFIVIDTGPAHSAADDEDDNRDMHKLAMAMRDLMVPLGNPATVALMHPTKSAERDNLQPRGGGAFSGSIDGELCAWQENGKIEFFHRTKFRGPGFSSIWFDIEKYTLPAMVDNFGTPVLTVLAVEDSTGGPATRGGKLPRRAEIAFRALQALFGDDCTVYCENPAWAQEAAKELGCAPPTKIDTVKNWRKKTDEIDGTTRTAEAARKAFERAMKHLVDADLVTVWKGMCWIA
jgi:hypothetical protein